MKRGAQGQKIAVAWTQKPIRSLNYDRINLKRGFDRHKNRQIDTRNVHTKSQRLRLETRERTPCRRKSSGDGGNLQVKQEEEDELHFILRCSGYVYLRQKYIHKHWPETRNVTLKEILTTHDIMKIKDISMFIFYSMKRKEYLLNT